MSCCEGGIGQLALLPLPPVVTPLRCLVSRIMIWPTQCAQPTVPTGLAQASGHVLGAAQCSFQAGPCWSPGAQAQGCSARSFMENLNRARANGTAHFLASVSGTHQNAMQRRRVRSALAEPLTQGGATQEGKEGATGASGTGRRNSPSLKTTTEKTPLEGKCLACGCRGAPAPCSSGT